MKIKGQVSAEPNREMDELRYYLIKIEGRNSPSESRTIHSQGIAHKTHHVDNLI